MYCTTCYTKQFGRYIDKSLYKLIIDEMPLMGKEFMDAMLGNEGTTPWESQKRGPDGAWELFTRPFASSSLIQTKICFNIATDIRSALELKLGKDETRTLLAQAHVTVAKGSSGRKNRVLRYGGALLKLRR